MITLAHIRFADLTLIKTIVPFHYKERNIFINIQTCVHKFGKARIYLILFIRVVLKGQITSSDAFLTNRFG